MDEEELDDLAPKALGLFEDVSSYDPKDAPSNGYEYLCQVMNESTKISKTVVADIDLEKFKKNQTVFIDESDHYPVSQDIIPTQEWQERQVEHFTKFKAAVDAKRALWDLKKTHKKSLLNGANPYLPEDITSEDSWFQLYENSQPKIKTFLHLKQIDIDSLLYLLASWLERDIITFCHHTNMWIFSTLAFLQEPLLPITCSNMRAIVKMALQKRSALTNANDDLLPSLNLLICIVARFFRQADLGD